MSAQENARLAQIPYQAYNSRHFDDAAALVADDFELRDMASGETFRGPTGMKEALKRWADAFPDSTIEVQSVMAADTGAVVEFIGRGTNTGPLTTPGGTLPPTNRTAELHCCDVMTIKNAKIATSHSYMDMATMLRQLGLIPEGVGARATASGAFAG